MSFYLRYKYNIYYLLSLLLRYNYKQFRVHRMESLVFIIGIRVVLRV